MTRFKWRAAAAAALLTTGGAARANTVFLTAADRVSPPLTAPATGLQGRYYDGSAFYLTPVNHGALEATAFIAGRPADATFTATNVSYCNTATPQICGVFNDANTSLVDFLGADGASLHVNTYVRDSREGQILALDGYFNIVEGFDQRADLPGIGFRFGADVDDDFSATLGGQLLSKDNFILADVPGLYAFHAVYLEGGGNTGLGIIYGNDDSIQLLGGAYFYQSAGNVPEPAVWSLMLGGFGILGVSARRQRRSAVSG